MLTSSDHMPPLKLMRTTSRMPPYWLKGWLSKLLFLIRTFQNGLPLSIVTSSYQTLMKRTKKWWSYFMQMPFMMGMSWNVGLKERTSWLHPPILPSFCAIILNINWPVFQKPLVYDDLDPEVDLLREILDKTWSSLSMGNQSMFHHYLPNWGCSQQSFSTTSILSQALGTWILVGLYSFMTWSLIKKSIFAHISSKFWAKLLRELPQGTTFLFVALYQKFWSLKAFIHWKMSTFILSKVQSTFALSILASVIAERESSKRVMLLMVVHALTHIPMMRS